MVTIMCGVNSLPTDKAVGMSVGDIRKKYRDTLSIPNGARAILDGKPVDDETVVRSGQELEFVKETGEKGC